MSDTTTTLNPGTGGDSMDESLVIQSDGATTGKRPRVELALSDAGAPSIPQLVNRNSPLPVSLRDTDSMNMLLQAILDELREIRNILAE